MTRLLRGRGRRGQTLVEFGLILPVFVLLLIGIFDFGRAIYADNTIQNAAREAVRVGIVDQSCNVIGSEADARASSLAVSWDPTILSPCVDAESEIEIRFLQPALDGTTCPSPVSIGCYVEVTIRYQYTAATPIIGNLVGTIQMEAVSRQQVEFSNATP